MPTVSLQDELQAIKSASLYRRLRRVENDQGPTLILDGREVINLSSNNYLGIANHPALAEAAKRAIDQYGCGSGASRLISGNMALHEELENRLNSKEQKPRWCSIPAFRRTREFSQRSPAMATRFSVTS
jgi:7-keto-8-aminopelargonate synthetase-like enzyme